MSSTPAVTSSTSPNTVTEFSFVVPSPAATPLPDSPPGSSLPAPMGQLSLQLPSTSGDVTAGPLPVMSPGTEEDIHQLLDGHLGPRTSLTPPRQEEMELDSAQSHGSSMISLGSPPVVPEANDSLDPASSDEQTLFRLPTRKIRQSVREAATGERLRSLRNSQPRPASATTSSSCPPSGSG